MSFLEAVVIVKTSSSAAGGSSVGLVFRTPEGVVIEQANRLGFKAFNNEAEYEALIVGILTVRKLGVQDLVIYCDSQLVTSQLTSEYAVRNEMMGPYMRMAQKLIKEFRTTYIKRFPITSKSHADALATLASAMGSKLKRTIEVEYLPNPSTEIGGNRPFVI